MPRISQAASETIARWNGAFLNITVLVLFQLPGWTSAAPIIQVENTTSAPLITWEYVRLIHSDITIVKENLDPYDSQESLPPGGPVLRAYTQVGSYFFSIDSRPVESITVFDVKLAVWGGPIAGPIDNFLRCWLRNPPGYEHRSFHIRQIWPVEGSIYEIPKDGSVLIIPLADLVNPANGVYAIWRVTFDRNVPADIYGPAGIPDGTADAYDLERLVEDWLLSSAPNGIPDGSGNYLVTDLNLDRLTNLADLAGLASCWLQSE